MSFNKLLIPTYKLRKLKCYRNIIFDKDDTLTKHLSPIISEQQIRSLIYRLKQDKTIQMRILSNSTKEGVDGIQCIPMKHGKPYNHKELREWLKRQKWQLDNTIIVGDRILTDIFVGNLVGIDTCLVDPIECTTIRKHGYLIYLMRTIESFLNKQPYFDSY